MDSEQDRERTSLFNAFGLLLEEERAVGRLALVAYRDPAPGGKRPPDTLPGPSTYGFDAPFDVWLATQAARAREVDRGSCDKVTLESDFGLWGGDEASAFSRLPSSLPPVEAEAIANVDGPDPEADALGFDVVYDIWLRDGIVEQGGVDHNEARGQRLRRLKANPDDLYQIKRLSPYIRTRSAGWWEGFFGALWQMEMLPPNRPTERRVLGDRLNAAPLVQLLDIHHHLDDLDHPEYAANVALLRAARDRLVASADAPATPGAADTQLSNACKRRDSLADEEHREVFALLFPRTVDLTAEPWAQLLETIGDHLLRAPGRRHREIAAAFDRVVTYGPADGADALADDPDAVAAAFRDALRQLATVRHLLHLTTYRQRLEQALVAFGPSVPTADPSPGAAPRNTSPTRGRRGSRPHPPCASERGPMLRRLNALLGAFAEGAVLDKDARLRMRILLYASSA